jgi:hypothetical protein
MRAARAHLSRLDLCCEGTFNGDFSRAENCRAIQKSAAKQFKIPSKLALFRCPRRPSPSAKPSFFKIAIDLRLRALLRQG